MALTAGARLGVYEIVAPLGAGGMGEVYRARDTRLGRDVAVKVLPPDVVADPERVARFEREAQVLASLNHPNIAHIHGVEESTGTLALVMELVDGPTLADRTAKGPLPVDEALTIARQIAEGIEAAHEQGIIHRDLKPANIKVRDDGAVKILDFGLAKAFEPKQTSAVNATQSPTITTPAMMTGIGVILGTAAYMSPEQAKGRPADKRSDIWAFGCVLYEMLTGRRVFAADDVSDTFAAVLRADVDWNALPTSTPPAIRALLYRCIERDRQRRVADASTIRLVLDEPSILQPSPASDVPSANAARTTTRRRRALMWIAVLGGIAATATGVWFLKPEPSVPRAVARFLIPLAESTEFGSNGLHLPAVSPDGSQIAYAAITLDTTRAYGTQRLYVRSLADNAVRAVSGTESESALGAPVFSPDGATLAYFVASGSMNLGQRTSGTLKRIPVEGGSAVSLARLEFPFGMSWSGDSILVGQAAKGIVRVPASGGEPDIIVQIKNDEIAQGPHLLPDGNAVLFTLVRGVVMPNRGSVRLPSGTNSAAPTFPIDDTWDKGEIVVQDLKTGERKTLIQGGSDAHFLPTGHIVYAVAGTLRAARFEPRGRTVVGKPATVVEGIVRTRFGPAIRTGGAHFSVSSGGTLAYVPGPASPASTLQELAFLDRNRSFERVSPQPARYEYPRFSPDAKRVVFGISDDKNANVWIYDLSASSPMRQLTFTGRNRYPVWSADGQYVTFQSDREGDAAIFWQRADGSEPAQRLTTAAPDTAHIPTSWSPRNEHLLLEEHSGSRMKLAIMSARDRRVTPLGVESTTVPPAAVFSPNGRWIAYQTGEDDPRILVQPFPTSGTTYPVGNGLHPRWSSDGRTLFYTVTNRVFAAAVTTTPTFAVANPAIITQGFTMADRRTNYDVAPDGNRILGVADLNSGSTPSARNIQVVLNWFDELKARVPVK